jgi:hypothetical protein
MLGERLGERLGEMLGEPLVAAPSDVAHAGRETRPCDFVHPFTKA